MRKLIRVTALTAAVVGTVATLAVTPSVAVAHQATPAGRGVLVETVRVPVRGQHPVTAYLVRTAGTLRPHSHAGILFLHWLGQIHSDRSEFLAEAAELAPSGAVSLLPQGVFPWQVGPTGKPHDVTAVKAQLAVFRACLTWLRDRKYVAGSRIAVVGHDYGAMYGALLANSDKHVHAAVLATPDATWGHWFVQYWLGYTGQQVTDYDKLFAHLQPVHHVARLGNRELFQWAGQDVYIGSAVRSRFAASAPKAKVDLYPTSDHQLTDQAQADRDTFLRRELHLSK